MTTIMTRNSLRTLLISAAAATLLTGCGGTHGVYSESSGSWSNYKCTAVNTQSGGHTAVGWATRESYARSNALGKCRAHSAHPDGCQITHCVGE